jgi:gamma-butyrobetaine dioxygenase
MFSDTALLEWMLALEKYGLALINNMPATEVAVIDAAERIDYLRRTNFGNTFDVVSVPKPINLAYTALALPLHTDLANFEVAPGYQFLHCLKNSSTGGESTFVDGLRVLEDLRASAPDYFRLLAENPIPFRFHDETHDIRQYHPVIHLDYFGAIIEIRYNAHLADVFDLPEDIMHDYYLAYRALMARLRDPRYMICLRLGEGQLAVFDNRRVLHGRRAFDPATGKRHLRGCYVDRSEFSSRLRVLQRHLNRSC